MPYLARRRMVGGGVQYEGGDVIPAENWPTRRALISCGRIEFVAALPKKKNKVGRPPKVVPKLDTVMAPVPIPVTAALPKTESIPLISMRVGDIRKRIAKIKDLEYLNQLLEQETKGKNRATATVAIENRIKAVRN